MSGEAVGLGSCNCVYTLAAVQVFWWCLRMLYALVTNMELWARKLAEVGGKALGREGKDGWESSPCSAEVQEQ